MATPVDFPGTNRHYVAPKGEEYRTSDLHAFNNGRGVTVIRQQLTPEELAEINTNGGLIWLALWAGDSIPPSFVHVNTATVREVMADYGPLWKETESDPDRG